MDTFKKLIICEEDEEQTAVENVSGIEQVIDCSVDDFGFEKTQRLEAIVFQLSAQPKILELHLQRIYFCYQNDLNEDLFAALVDFLIILDGHGSSLRTKMVFGAKNKLSSTQFKLLAQALNNSTDELLKLEGGEHSVFTHGLIGHQILIIKQEEEAVIEHDPLDIARDCIAYSQLETAMETLENAVLRDFKRQELHDDLLELYKVTKSLERFNEMYATVSKQFENIPAGWDELKGFFNG